MEFPPVDGLFRSGRLMSSLRGDGVEPEDVDTVFYTHMHLDHVGWTVTGGSLTFPNARHMAGEVHRWSCRPDAGRGTTALVDSRGEVTPTAVAPPGTVGA